jgi:hypothetical protein
MDRYTRREYFERICQLRDRYAHLGRTDTTGVITIDAMIARACRLMDRPVSPLLMVTDANPASGRSTD